MLDWKLEYLSPRRQERKGSQEGILCWSTYSLAIFAPLREMLNADNCHFELSDGMTDQSLGLGSPGS
jgi:hypothetical protein